MSGNLAIILMILLGSNAQSQTFVNHNGIVLLKLLKIPDKDIFALSETSIIVKGAKYNLGEGFVFLNTVELVEDSALLKKIKREAIDYDVFKTKLFRDSVGSDFENNEINYGGETFVSSYSNGNKVADTFYIAYNIKGRFICYDSSNGRNIIFKRLHCYENDNTVSYPVFTPLNIKKNTN